MNSRLFLFAAVLLCILVLLTVVNLTMKNPMPPSPDDPVSAKVLIVTQSPSATVHEGQEGLHAIAIEALDEKGEPLAEASLRIQDENQKIVAEGSIIQGKFQTALKAGLYRVSIELDPNLYFPFEGQTAEIQGPSTIHIRINRKYKIHGFIVNTQHVPLTNASVFLQSQESMLNFVTDQNGYFSFWPLQYREHIMIVSHSEYDQWQKSIYPATNPVTVVLHQGTLLTVHTLDETNTPVGGTEVSCQANLEPQGLYMKSQISNIVGQVYFNEIQSGTYTFTAKPPYPAVVQPFTQYISSGEPHEVTVTIQRKTVTITGTVMEYQTNHVIPSVTVVCRGAGKETRCLSDPAGRFAFPGLHHGIHTLFAEPIEGYLSGDFSQFARDGASPPTQSAFYIDSDVHDVVLYLKKGWIIRGQVVDGMHRPISDAILSMRLEFKASSSRLSSTVIPGKAITQENGQFILYGQMENTNPFASLQLTASHAIYKSTSTEIPFPQSGQEIEGLVFVMPQQLNVKGVVKSETGSAIKNAYIAAWISSSTPTERKNIAASALSADDGQYALSIQEEGPYNFKVKADGYLPFELTNLNIVSKKENVIDFVLKHDLEGEINGYVLDHEYQPVENALIYIEPYDQDPVSIRSSSHLYAEIPKFFGDYCGKSEKDGFFKIPSPILMLDHYTNPRFKVTAIKEAHQNQAIAEALGVEAGTKNLILVMTSQIKKIAQIYGQVVYQNQPVTEYGLYIQSSDPNNPANLNQSWQSIQSPDGRFFMEVDIADCPLLLIAHHPDHGLTYSQPLVLHPDEVINDLVLTFQDRVHIQGKVVNANTKEPLGGVTVWYSQSTDYTHEKVRFVNSRIRSQAGTMPDQIISVNQPVTTAPDGTFRLPVPKSKIWVHGIRSMHYPKSLFLDCTLAPAVYTLQPIELLPVGRSITRP